MGHVPAGMIKRLSAPTAAVLFGLLLGSCSSTSAFVSDHWPHWAGGEPKGLPPRPGTPGYQQFIAHSQANEDAAAATGSAPVAAGPVAPGAPVSTVQVAPAATPNVGQGGLY